MISVIIPTWNRRQLLLRAIASVLQQTYADLECIVVDDGSTDGTAEAVRRIADPRVRYVHQDRNAGACAARNCGMGLAKGQYIAFQDSDDVWDANKLERQLALITATGADIVVCAMRRVNGNGTEEIVPGHQPKGDLTEETLLRGNLCSTQCILGRAEVLRSVGFDADMPRLQDWDMILRAAQTYRVYFHPEPLCTVYLQPDSISQQPCKLLTALQRLYLRHHAAILADEGAKRSRTIPLAFHWLQMLEQAAMVCGMSPWTEELLDHAPAWVYRQGQELPGRVVIHMEEKPANPADGAVHLVTKVAHAMQSGHTLLLPDLLLTDALHAAAGRAEFAWTGAAIPPCEGVARTIRTGLCALSAAHDRRYAWEVLAEAFGGARVAAEMAAVFLLDMPPWARMLKSVPLPLRDGPVRRVGVYYHSLRGGGVQRAAAALIDLWVQMGHEVTLITTQEPSADEYPIPDGVQRRIIPAMDPAGRDACRDHAAALAEAAESLDLLVYHAWADPMILFDLLAVKSTGCRFLVHTHSTFTMPLLEEGMLDRFESLPDVYALADGVVTLSETDACYWRHCCARVYRTVHPLTYRPGETLCNALAGQTILWAGRLTDEKRPMDALSILRQVVQVLPGTRLILLGGGDAQAEEALRRCIDADGLREHVEMPGFTADPAPYFRRADAFLCTSAYEGFGLAMAEAQTHGVPVVTYDMPYLTILQGGGHISVPQQDVQAAAQALIRLLSDGPYRCRLGAEARCNVEENLDIDQEAQWSRIFAELEAPAAPIAGDDASALMLRTLREHVLLSRTQPGRGAAVRQTAFVPLPEKGPFKTLRKKAATFAQVLLIDGPEGVAQVVKNKLGS